MKGGAPVSAIPLRAIQCHVCGADHNCYIVITTGIQLAISMLAVKRPCSLRVPDIQCTDCGPDPLVPGPAVVQPSRCNGPREQPQFRLGTCTPGVRLVVASELSYQEESEVQVEGETNVFC
jgi:hypothetical protein